MANLPWGKVYFHETYAGTLKEEPGGRTVFTYDPSYLESGQPLIAHHFPLRKEPFVSEWGLHPFFDNLVAEGWLQNAQAKSLGIKPNQRLRLLLGFGFDLIGAVSIIDIEKRPPSFLDQPDEVTAAAIRGSASLSGVQRKLLVVHEGKKFRPVNSGELSTHIAKLSFGSLEDLIELEYLTTEAMRHLLPHDEIVRPVIGKVDSISEQALIIPRFDRVLSENKIKRVHFEEFNQLLNLRPDEKYDQPYEAMGDFIRKTPTAIPAESDRLFRRILACLLMGNTDAHLKNFAMFHTHAGLRLTPAYDLVAASAYKQFQSIALPICGMANRPIGQLKPEHLISMGEGFGLNNTLIETSIQDLGKNLPDALQIIADSDIGSQHLRDRLLDRLEKRWNDSFKSIGPLLSKKRKSGAKA